MVYYSVGDAKKLFENDPCYVCLYGADESNPDLPDQTAVAHNGLHPAHRLCVKRWIAQQEAENKIPLCPTCKEPIEPYRSLKDRVGRTVCGLAAIATTAVVTAQLFDLFLSTPFSHSTFLKEGMVCSAGLSAGIHFVGERTIFQRAYPIIEVGGSLMAMIFSKIWRLDEYQSQSSAAREVYNKASNDCHKIREKPVTDYFDATSALKNFTDFKEKAKEASEAKRFDFHNSETCIRSKATFERWMGFSERFNNESTNLLINMVKGMGVAVVSAIVSRAFGRGFRRISDWWAGPSKTWIHNP